MYRICFGMLVIFGVVLAQGCAFTPQQANLAPTVSVMTSSEGKGLRVGVRVVDERPSKSLGRRGAGMYGGAGEISSSQDLAAVVHQKVVEAMQAKGFNPVDYKETDDPRLTIEIRLLEYSTSVGFWTGGVHVKGALKAQAIHGAESYERFYRSEEEKRVVIVPTAASNEVLINLALTELLNQLLNDQGLFKFLAS